MLVEEHKDNVTSTSWKIAKTFMSWNLPYPDRQVANFAHTPPPLLENEVNENNDILGLQLPSKLVVGKKINLNILSSNT